MEERPAEGAGEDADSHSIDSAKTVPMDSEEAVQVGRYIFVNHGNAPRNSKIWCVSVATCFGCSFVCMCVC